jgi:2-oxoglutarate/2-oxoacid ferredoxin oxidoreductase subunit beta
MSELKLFNTTEKSTWCPGCGDFGILAGIKAALAALDLMPHQAMIVSGIGCGSKLPHYMTVNAYNSLHGRAVPIAQGIKLANHNLKVIIVTGDGDGYGIGANHLMQGMRRNADVTHIIENNQIYGLTKGQYSPTSDKGVVTSFSPEGSIEAALNPLALALAAGATFISRTFAGDVKHMSALIQEAVKHPGYSVVDTLQPCVTYNKVNTYDWYRERVYKVEEEAGYNPTDRDQAWTRAQEWGDRIPVGIVYQDTSRATYESQVSALQKGPLVQQELNGRYPDYDALKEALV